MVVFSSSAYPSLVLPLSKSPAPEWVRPRLVMEARTGVGTSLCRWWQVLCLGEPPPKTAFVPSLQLQSEDSVGHDGGQDLCSGAVYLGGNSIWGVTPASASLLMSPAPK